MLEIPQFTTQPSIYEIYGIALFEEFMLGWYPLKVQDLEEKKHYSQQDITGYVTYNTIPGATNLIYTLPCSQQSATHLKIGRL